MKNKQDQLERNKDGFGPKKSFFQKWELFQTTLSLYDPVTLCKKIETPCFNFPKI